MIAPTECGTSEPASALRAQSARHQSTETRLANSDYADTFRIRGCRPGLCGIPAGIPAAQPCLPFTPGARAPRRVWVQGCDHGQARQRFSSINYTLSSFSGKIGWSGEEFVVHAGRAWAPRRIRHNCCRVSASLAQPHLHQPHTRHSVLLGQGFPILDASRPRAPWKAYSRLPTDCFRGALRA
jgi:hypothetical protein